MSSQNMKRVISGIQPTGGLHLGNLLGAILRWVRMQDQAECLLLPRRPPLSVRIICDPDERRASAREMAAALIASGIDPEQVADLRPKRGAGAFGAVLDPQRDRTHGLAQPHDAVEGQGRQESRRRIGRPVRYPVLQAADILLYQATHVPVGEDQKQHIELTRDIALKFNADYDTDVFVVPEPFIGGGPRRG